VTHTVWFVRHGESTANAGRWLAGHRDPPLTATGRDQAMALREPLRELRPAVVWSSDLQRAMQTAALAWDGPVTPVAALRERSLGDLEGQALAAVTAAGQRASLRTWFPGPPGGESLRELANRLLGWLAAHDRGTDAMLFCHAGPIRTLVGLLDGTPRDRIGLRKVGNTEVVARQIGPQTWAQLHASVAAERTEDRDPGRRTP